LGERMRISKEDGVRRRDIELRLPHRRTSVKEGVGRKRKEEKDAGKRAAPAGGLQRAGRTGRAGRVTVRAGRPHCMRATRPHYGPHRRAEFGRRGTESRADRFAVQVWSCVVQGRGQCSTTTRHEVEYLGYIIDEWWVHVDIDKIQFVRDWPTPNTLRELRNSLGLADIYRRFVLWTRDF
jgi:hypothetical protein